MSLASRRPHQLAIAIAVVLACWRTTASHAQGPATRPAANPRLLNLPANQWVAIHQQKPGDAVRFKRQEHGGSCFDSRRCRVVLFGSNTHGEDWTNSPLIFDVVVGSWSRLYADDDKSTYRAAGEEAIAVAGEARDHPWAMHTMGSVVYDERRDRMVVCSWPEHEKPGRFTDALADVWPTVKKHPTWTFDLEKETWSPLRGKPQHFFPYACAYDSDRGVIVGYGGAGVWELRNGSRIWIRVAEKALCGWHNNAVYDSANKAVLVFGSNERSDEMIVYRPSTGEHRKMPTVGVRPPKDQHTPMCFEPQARRAVVVVDRGGSVTRPQEAKAETWLYDLVGDAWMQVESATLPFGCGMNYNMHYDDRHRVCLLVTEDFSSLGNPVTVYALRLHLSKLDRQ